MKLQKLTLRSQILSEKRHTAGGVQKETPVSASGNSEFLGRGYPDNDMSGQEESVPVVRLFAVQLTFEGGPREFALIFILFELLARPQDVAFGRESGQHAG